MLIIIRRATAKDLETIYKIERECFTIEAFTKEQVAYFLQHPNAISLVAQINSETAGFIIGLIHHYNETKTGHICTVDIAVKHRRKGIGQRLLSELEQIFIERGVEMCYLEVRMDNRAARELYRKQGYVEAEHLRDYYSIGIHGIRLKKKLVG